MINCYDEFLLFTIDLWDVQMCIPIDDGKIKKRKVIYHIIPSTYTIKIRVSIYMRMYRMYGVCLCRPKSIPVYIWFLSICVCVILISNVGFTYGCTRVIYGFWVKNHSHITLRLFAYIIFKVCLMLNLQSPTLQGLYIFPFSNWKTLY